jgi:hypothetical protein
VLNAGDPELRRGAGQPSDGSCEDGWKARLAVFGGDRVRLARGEKAVKAVAHYLACLVQRMLTQRQEYVDRGAAYYEANAPRAT